MSNDRLKYLLKQYAIGASTPAEVRELFRWISKSDNDILLKEKIRELWDNYGGDRELPEVDWNEIYYRIINTPQVGKKTRWWKYAAAAVIILSLSTAGYLFFNKSSEQNLSRKEQPQRSDQILPGGDRAILTLADGTQVFLDSADVGTLSQQGRVKVIKLNNGQLSYQFTDNSLENDEILFNTISTPKGSQYQIVLADGTKVWLNASSSLRFPATFTGNERNVELRGEGYFEVARNGKKPFNVSIINGMTVKVLGTHFNVNAYDDDATVKTTLLEGSVEIEKGNANKIIKPGEQATIGNTSSDSKIKVSSVDVDDVIAWKNGRFIFHDDNIQSVMNQLARWYDVTVSYEGDITNEEFVGVINRSRYESIMDILDMLEKTRTVSFEVIGRHVIVKPYDRNSV